MLTFLEPKDDGTEEKQLMYLDISTQKHVLQPHQLLHLQNQTVRSLSEQRQKKKKNDPFLPFLRQNAFGYFES